MIDRHNARAVVLVVAVAVVMLPSWARPSAGDTARPAPTPRPWGRPVYLQVDEDLRIEACDGLAQVIGTRPPPLVGCRPWQSCRPCEPGRADHGQVFVLWPSVWRYRVYRPGGTAPAPETTPTPDATATPETAPACVPVIVVVTATPTDAPRPTETMESTPTAIPTRVYYWPVVVQRRGR